MLPVLALCSLLSSPIQQDAATWRRVLEISGTSTKQTDLFHISGSKWRISWAVKSKDRITIGVMDKEGNVVSVASGSDGADVTHIHKSGTFYLNITSSGPYKIVVDEFR